MGIKFDMGQSIDINLFFVYDTLGPKMVVKKIRYVMLISVTFRVSHYMCVCTFFVSTSNKYCWCECRNWITRFRKIIKQQRNLQE